MRSPYRVIRLSGSSRASGSNLKRYHQEEGRELLVTHTSESKDGKNRFWLRSKGIISWFIETPLTLEEFLHFRELEGIFDEEDGAQA